jgi:hypothetical protein
VRFSLCDSICVRQRCGCCSVCLWHWLAAVAAVAHQSILAVLVLPQAPFVGFTSLRAGRIKYQRCTDRRHRPYSSRFTTSHGTIVTSKEIRGLNTRYAIRTSIVAGTPHKNVHEANNGTVSNQINSWHAIEQSSRRDENCRLLISNNSVDIGSHLLVASTFLLLKWTCS